MLILSRHEGEEIVIGRDVVLRVTAITPSRVEIAVDAPREVTVRRGEQEDEEAAK